MDLNMKPPEWASLHLLQLRALVGGRIRMLNMLRKLPCWLKRLVFPGCPAVSHLQETRRPSVTSVYSQSLDSTLHPSDWLARPETLTLSATGSRIRFAGVCRHNVKQSK
jgi:hypothetical protein